MITIVAVMATVVISAGFALVIRRWRSRARFLVLTVAIGIVIALGVAWDRTSDPETSRTLGLASIAMTMTVVAITLLVPGRNARRRGRRG